MSEARTEYVTEENDAIRFGAQVFKIQTLVDGGIRLTLDLVAPTDPQTIIDLFDAKQPGVILEIAAVSVKQEQIRNGKIPTRSKWEPEGAT